MTRPANDAGIAIVGPLTASSGSWRLPARLHLSAPLHFGDDGIRSTRLRAHVAGRYESGNTQLPFTATIDSPLLLRGGTLALRSEEHTSELQSLMRISYAVFCLTKK